MTPLGRPPGVDPLRRDRRLLHRGDVRPGPDPARRLRRLGRPARAPPRRRRRASAPAVRRTPTSPCAAASSTTSSAPSSTRRCAMPPDLVSMVGGGNDLLRPTVDLDRLAARLEEAVVRIRHSGADVLLATPTDTRDAGVFKPLRGRHAVHTANIFTIAQRHGCLRAQPLGDGGAAGLADVGRGPHPPHERGPPPGRPRRAHRARARHRPRDWTTPLPPAERATRRRGAPRPRRVGPHPRSLPGSSAGCRAVRPATRCWRQAAAPRALPRPRGRATPPDPS